MSTIRNPEEIDPRVLEANEDLDYECPIHNVGDRVRLNHGEVGLVVRTWYNEMLQCQECYVCFDDGGNPWHDPEDKCGPYLLTYLASSIEPLGWDKDPGLPWDGYDHVEDLELDILCLLVASDKFMTVGEIGKELDPNDYDLKWSETLFNVKVGTAIDRLLLTGEVLADGGGITPTYTSSAEIVKEK